VVGFSMLPPYKREGQRIGYVRNNYNSFYTRPLQILFLYGKRNWNHWQPRKQGMQGLPRQLLEKNRLQDQI